MAIKSPRLRLGLFIAPKCVKSQNQLPFHTMNCRSENSKCCMFNALSTSDPKLHHTLLKTSKLTWGVSVLKVGKILDQVKPPCRDLEREYNAMKEKIQGLLLKDNQSMIGCTKYQISSLNPYKIHTH